MKDSLFRDWDNGNKYVKSAYQGAQAKIGHLEYLYDYLKEKSLADWVSEDEGYTVGEIVFDVDGLYRNTIEDNTTKPSVNSPSNGWILLSNISTPYVPPTAPYKVYTALLTQSATSAPVATILQNTLGQIPTYGYTGKGKYSVAVTGSALTLNKTSIEFGSNINPANTGTIVAPTINTTSLTTSGFSINTTDSTGSTINEVLLITKIEIRVYN